ncbi:LuxR C-terminal-related transcriptional regulator [Acetobacter malorum]|uniref:helix-turn-helix transcriptional regulator n=1 Tax=Acetobacter malorum TaxID=178901 RepID=UPI0009EED811|nr:LuxR C-terminal-related transcriptional regulator [Acetobacter malorum]
MYNPSVRFPRRLSPSQAKISCLLTEGLSIKEAALKMGISEGTARQMVKEIFSRLEINSQNKLISFVKSVNFIC